MGKKKKASKRRREPAEDPLFDLLARDAAVCCLSDGQRLLTFIYKLLCCPVGFVFALLLCSTAVDAIVVTADVKLGIRSDVVEDARG